MFGSSDEGGRGSILFSTIKTVVFIGGLSYVAANWLSSSTDRQALSRLAGNASQGAVDPLTTGSVGGRANASRLDPCGAQRR